MDNQPAWLRLIAVVIGVLVGISALIIFFVDYTTTKGDLTATKGELEGVRRELAVEKERNRRAFELLQWGASEGKIPYPRLVAHLSQDDAAQIAQRAGLEVCSYINPLIVQPTHGETVSSRTTVQGTVSKVPNSTDSFLWLMTYELKKATYINAGQLTVDTGKQWRKEVDFTGSMVGSRCSLQVIVADSRTHIKLNGFAKSRQAPLKINRCTEVEVIIGP